MAETVALSRNFGIEHPHTPRAEAFGLESAALDQAPDVALADPEYLGNVAHAVGVILSAHPVRSNGSLAVRRYVVHVTSPCCPCMTKMNLTARIIKRIGVIV